MSLLDDRCQVYWGSHACRFQSGHDAPCECDCCDCPSDGPCAPWCVAKPPYYGAETRFYGGDVETRGLRGMTE